MKNILLSIGFICLAAYGNAQSYDHENWKLSKETKMDKVKADDVKDYPYHYLSYEQNDQIIINKETSSYNKFTAVHAKVHINTAKGADEFKSLYQSGTKEFFQYRIIKADGEVIDKNDEEEEDDITRNININNLRDLSFLRFLGGGTKISGLDSNCQLEFIFVTKQSYLKNKGDKYGVNFIQDEVPIYNYEYNHITPENYIYKVSGFNGCPEVEEDESDDKNYLTISLDKVDAFHKSAITASGANKMGFTFTLYKNTFYSKTERAYKYSTYSRFIFENYMKHNTAQDKVVKKYLKKKTELEGKAGFDRLQTLEILVKDELDYGYGSYTLEEVVKQRRADAIGKMKLFCAILNYWGEKYEIVNVNNRRGVPFDDTYENYLYLDNVMLFFPEYEVYMSPTSSYGVLELIPSSYRENKGIYTKKIGVGDFSSGTHYTEDVPGLDCNINYFNKNIDINTTERKVRIEERAGGMQGLTYWNTLKDISAQDKEDFFDGLSKVKCSDANVLNDNVGEVSKFKTPYKNAIEFDYSFKTNQLLTYKNNNTLGVSIGRFINESTGLQEKPKGNYPPDIYAGYIKKKVITIDILPGYTLSNAEALNKDYSFNSGDTKDAIVFKMSHKVVGNKIVIEVTEKMAKGMFAAADMDNFLKVYNAAWNARNLKAEFTKK